MNGELEKGRDDYRKGNAKKNKINGEQSTNWCVFVQ